MKYKILKNSKKIGLIFFVDCGGSGSGSSSMKSVTLTLLYVVFVSLYTLVYSGTQKISAFTLVLINMKSLITEFKIFLLLLIVVICRFRTLIKFKST